jgi:nitrogen fixation/metabolism regulation signal transduction histidine kinase
MENGPVDAETLRVIKHDIKNQLSNIQLAIENMRYEVTNPTDDFTFCLDIITTSSAKIDALLKPLN